MSCRKRIAITADPFLPVPPRHYGGIERIVHLLTLGLIDRGWDVTLFGHPDSNVPCCLAPYPAGGDGRRTFLRNMCWVTSRVLREQYHVIHSFSRLGYLLPVLPLRTPVIMSYQRPITTRSVRWGERLSRGRLHFVGCSHDLIRSYAGQTNWHFVYNAVATDQYSFSESVPREAPLVVLGRVEEIKGTHIAIEVAKRTGRRLIIAGNVAQDKKHRRYFESRISPHLDDHQITFVGPVDDRQKNFILGQAAALLMPIQWDEPFGIVMIEALACGTPVIGLRRGALPEIVEDGINGFVCDDVDEMAAAVGSLDQLARPACRRTMEEKFSDRCLVDGYERIYQTVRKARG